MESFFSDGNDFVEKLIFCLHKPEYKNSRIVVLADINTEACCLRKIIPALEGFDYKTIVIKDGEESKCIDTCSIIWRQLLEYKCDRDTLMLILGGGVLCDIGGFTASCFKRGIKYFYIPTTLLSQTDAAWGGKNGINFGRLKNQIGLFSDAELVAINTSFLETQTTRQFEAGMAEIIKHSIIHDPSILDDIDNITISNKDILPLLKKSVAVKSYYVNRDYYDKNERKCLNFGHTIGHAVEAVYQDEVFHGEAVALGMLAALFLSSKYCGLSEDKQLYYSNKIRTILPHLPKIHDKETYKIYEKLTFDKKNTNDNINFVLIREVGEPAIDVAVTQDDIIEAIKYISVI